MRDRREMLALAGLLAWSLMLNLGGIGWGLPNGDRIWSTDALTPMAPLAVLYHLVKGGWNSGWFYYKYPLGHPLLLAVIYAPYLVWLRLTGGIGAPAADYPYGFADPERALLILAVLGRAASALMTAAATLLLYLACRELASRRAAWFASFFLASTFPVVFYAHTTNLDAAIVFWCTVALYAAARQQGRTRDRVGMIVFGAGAAMAIATKEYTMSFVIMLALLLLLLSLRRRAEGKTRAFLPAGTAAGLAVAVAVFVVMNGIVVNPLGMWHRTQFLTDSMPEALRQAYAPRFSHVGSAGLKSLPTEIWQLGETLRLVAVSMGWPVVFTAAAGGLLYGWQRPGTLLLVPALGYYLFSLRALEMLHPRYVLPLCVASAGLAGLALDWAFIRARAPVLGKLTLAMAAGLVLYAGVHGAGATWLLRNDTRYAAESWIRAHVPQDATVETYQRLTYLPRFSRSQVLTRIPFDQISIRHFVSRRPDFVVLSSAGIAGVTSQYKNELTENTSPDVERARVVSRRGTTGDVVSYEYKRNRAFLDALRAGCLGYRLAAVFRAKAWLAAPMIPSLAPTIWIYQRWRQAAKRPLSARCRTLLGADEYDPRAAAESGP